MKHILRALAFALGLSPLAAMAQVPPNLPADSVWGRLGFPGTVGPGQAIPFGTLKAMSAFPAEPVYVDDPQYGCKGDGVTDDTACIRIAITAASGFRGVMFSGKTYCVGPIKIGDGGLPVPAYLGGVGSASQLLACGTSASPTVTISKFPVGTNFKMFGIYINANEKHANGLLVHGCQFCIFENIRVADATGDGIVVHGEPNYNVQYSSFRDIISRFSGGNGFHFYSDNNTGDYYVAANVCSGLKSQGNTFDGYRIDYATVDCDGSESESNGQWGINPDHTKGGVWTVHVEGNTLGGVNATSNTTNLHFIGGRLTDSISATLLACASCSVDATDGMGHSNGWLNPTRITLNAQAPSGHILLGDGSNYSDFALAGGMSTFFGTSSSANLAAAVTDEVGTGKLLFNAIALNNVQNVDQTNASNLASGTVAAARGGAGAISGALAANGSGVVSQAATTNLSDVSSGTCTWSDQSGAALTLTGTSNCKWQKEGNWVHVYGTVTYPSTANATAAALGFVGAPTIPNQTYAALASPIKTSIGGIGAVVGVGIVNTTNLNFWSNGTNANVTNVSLSTATVTISLSYPAS